MKDVVDERVAQAAMIDDDLMRKRRRAAGDVTRQRILRLLRNGEWTAKEMAAKLAVGVNGLYYHLRVLEDAELIGPGSGRQSSSGMERTYQRGEKWLVTHELNEDLILAYQAILETAKHDCADVVYRMIAAVAKGEEPPYATVNAPGFVTTASEIKEFADRVWDLQQEFRQRGADLAAIGEDEQQPMKELFFTYALIEREPERQP